MAIDRHMLPYASCYCEENVWHLAGDERIPEQRRHVAFISNRHLCCALWFQRAASEPSLPVLWDYHVIMIASGEGGGPMVYDLDTTLDLPVPLDVYLRATFREPERLDHRLYPRFRVVDAGEYRRVFASDRSHMRAGDAWKTPPPSWPPIRPDGTPMNLPQFMDMDTPFLGEVLDLEGLRARFLGVLRAG